MIDEREFQRSKCVQSIHTRCQNVLVTDFGALVNRFYPINIEEQKDRRGRIEEAKSVHRSLASKSEFSKELALASGEPSGRSTSVEKLFLPREPVSTSRAWLGPKAVRSLKKMGQWKFIAPLSGCPTIEQMSRMLRLELVGLVLLACTQILTEHRNIYETRSLYGYRSKFLDPPERFTREVRVKQGRLRGIVVQPRTNHDLQPVDVFLGEIRGRK